MFDCNGQIQEALGTVRLEYEIASTGLESFRFVVVNADFGADVLLGRNFKKAIVDLPDMMKKI